MTLFVAALAAQQASPPKQTPEVKVNVLNVCSPTEEEQKEISTALASIPRQARFSGDFEVARGHTLEGGASDWVRIRRDYGSGPFGVAQFLFTSDAKASRETAVFVSKEAKGVTQIALEDNATPPVNASTLLATNTPVSRISLERFGKPHLVLARCPEGDQSKYEPLFKSASEIMSTYRTASGAREIVPAELGRLNMGVGPGARPPKVKPMGKK